MKNKYLNIFIHKILPIIIWLAAWEISAILFANLLADQLDIDNPSHFFPSLSATLRAILRIIRSEEFATSVFNTLTRVIDGILLGTLIGSILAAVCHKVAFLHSLVTPFNSIIKSTPIASIIIVLWISMSPGAIAVIISFLIVYPIIYENIYNGFSSIDKSLVELSTIYEFSFKKRIIFLVLPALKRYFIPAFITAIGLAFKAEIAAEIIVGGVTNCIGVMIYRAKDVPATDEVFAWTVIGIFFSILLESLAKMLLKATYRENSEVKS